MDLPTQSTPSTPTSSPLDSASLGSRSSCLMLLTRPERSKRELKIALFVLGLNSFEVGGLLGLGGFGRGILLRPTTGPGSPVAQVATFTSGLFWFSVMWLTGLSLLDMGKGSSWTCCCSTLVWVELCNDSDQQPVSRPQV
uniref:Uncharacterized protein n=1 Tax=Pipistrellus kuhlii TaxID=59472 RepID=A0A7J7W331_PIPKU|nr:hypothetical protein mPipKuh1_008188 [Pipistrellus kuhlii]